MPIPLTDVVYPLDESGQSPANRIVNERHELTSSSWSGFNLIIPYAAPFFDDSIEYLTHYPSGDRLERGRDWISGYLFQSCTGELGKFVSSCIYFFDTNLVGQVEIPSYQCLGGEWQVNQEQMTSILAEALLNPQRYYWEYVANLPQIFRPIDHDQDIDEFTELGLLLEAFREIANAVRDTPWGAQLQAHLIAHNPHDINKDDVGLGLVNNWSAATVSDFGNLNSLPATLYMNPAMTKVLIDNIAISALDAFKARRDNPNVVTANQTGALTAMQTQNLIAEFLTGGSSATIDAGFLQGRNYDQVVAGAMAEMENSLEQTKNEMLTQLQSILAGFQADDTSKFAGKTEGEWDLRIVQFARTISPVRRFDAIMDIVEDPNQNPINTVLSTEPTHTLIGVINKPAVIVRGGTQSFRLAMANTIVDVVLNRSTEDGVVLDYGVLPAGWSLYLDDDANGNRRLWVTAPANRSAIDIFNTATEDLTLSDGMVFYGASSANQYIHNNRFNLPLRRIIDSAQIATQIGTARNQAVADAATYTDQQVAGQALLSNQYADQAAANALSTANNNISTQASATLSAANSHADTQAGSALASASLYTDNQLATLEPKVTRAVNDGTYFEARFTVPAGDDVALGDVKIIEALHAIGLWGTSYQNSGGTAGTWWNGKPHDINTLKVDVLVRNGTRYTSILPDTLLVDQRTIAGDRTRVTDRVVFTNDDTNPVDLYVKFSLSSSLAVVLP